MSLWDRDPTKTVGKKTNRVRLTKLKEKEAEEEAVAANSKERVEEMTANFVDFYIMNPAFPGMAAVKAGYSKKVSRRQAAKMLAKDKIQEMIKIRREQLAQKYKVTPDKVIEEYARMAFVDPNDYYEASNTGGVVARSSRQVDLRPVKAIKETRSGKGASGKTTITYEFYDKPDALKSLRDIFGMDAPKKAETKNAHVIAGLSEVGGSREAVEAAIISAITGSPPPTPD